MERKWNSCYSKKAFFTDLELLRPDIIYLQEIKVMPVAVISILLKYQWIP